MTLSRCGIVQLLSIVVTLLWPATTATAVTKPNRVVLSALLIPNYGPTTPTYKVVERKIFSIIYKRNKHHS